MKCVIKLPNNIITSCFQFDKVVMFFGEDPAMTNPDEFFGVFDAFLTSFLAATEDNLNVRRRRQEEEKRLRHEQEVSGRRERLDTTMAESMMKT